MLSEAAAFLMAAIAPLRQGICVDCAARTLECSHEESLKATKELIANGYALAAIERCALCDRTRSVTWLRPPPEIRRRQLIKRSYRMNVTPQSSSP